MSEPPIEANAADPSAIGAALLLADLSDVVAETTAQLAALAGASPLPVAAPAPPVMSVQEAPEPPPPLASSLPATQSAPVIGTWPPGLPEQPSEAAAAPLWPEAAEPPRGSAALLAATSDQPGAASPFVLASSPPSIAAAPRSSVPAVLPADATPPAAPIAMPAATIRAASPAFDPVEPQPVSPFPDGMRSTVDRPAWNAPSAPTGPAPTTPDPWQPPVAPGPFGGTGSGAAQPGMASAAPPPAQDSSRPTGGDVFLDGVRVGRWLADTLAREAGGPAVGGTGFDPRLGPTWPGALQGNG